MQIKENHKPCFFDLPVLYCFHAGGKSETDGMTSEIESRFADTNVSIASLKKDNEKYRNDFQHVGEQVVMINSDYERTLMKLLD